MRKLIGNACHTLWFWRNKQKHDEEYTTPTSLTPIIHGKTKFYADSIKLYGRVSTRTHATIQVHFSPPGEGWTMMNVDGTVSN